MVCPAAVQLRDGGIEIAPPRAKCSSKDDGTASIILQVFNEHADKVEIEYQPASRQGDTKWGFWCDGRILKATIPYEFWKSYWYPELYPELNLGDQLQSKNAIQSLGSRKSSSPPICSGSQEALGSEGSSSPSVFASGIKICQCNPQEREDTAKRQHSPRQVSVSFQPMHTDDLNQAESSPGNSDNTRVIKVKCRGPPGSPATSENFERAIKVRCSRPASPIQASEPVGKMRCSTPTSPLPVTRTPSNGSQQPTAEGLIDSSRFTPTTAAEALARAKEALARVQLMSEGAPPHDHDTKPISSRRVDDFIDRSVCEAGFRCVTPCLPAGEALARARDAISTAHSMRACLKQAAPSTPKTRPPSKSALNTDAYARCAFANLSPIQLSKSSVESGISSDTSDLRLTKTFSGDTSDLLVMSARLEGTSCLQTGRHLNSVVVGRIILREHLKQERRAHWKTAVGKFMSKEKANLLRHGEKSKAFLKETVALLSRETDSFFSQGKRYLATKRQQWGLSNLECIFCLRIAPSSVNPDGIMYWKSFNDRKMWNTIADDSNKRCRLLVTTGTNTTSCSSPSK